MEKIDIRGIDKVKLLDKLYHQEALPEYTFCLYDPNRLTFDSKAAKKAIDKCMQGDKKIIEYFIGHHIFVDLTGDYVDTTHYETNFRVGTLKRVVDLLRKEKEKEKK